MGAPAAKGQADGRLNCFGSTAPFCAIECNGSYYTIDEASRRQDGSNGVMPAGDKY